MIVSAAVVNVPTILIAAVVAALFAAVIIRGIRRRKRGEGGCGCGCSGCPHSAFCHGGAESKPGNSKTSG